MGLSKLVKAASREQQNISQASRKKETVIPEQVGKTASSGQGTESTSLPLPSSGPDATNGSEVGRTVRAEKEAPVQAEEIRQPENVTEKKRRGRPSFKEKGMKVRKQYTLTLEEELYGLILEKAAAEKISFAKYLERAALEYMKRHNE